MKSVLTAASASLALVACSTPDMGAVRQAYFEGDYPAAIEKLEKFERSDSDNRHRWLLEKAIVQLTMGDPRSAAASLRTARDRMRRFDRYDHETFTDVGRILENAWSFLADDRVRNYEPADYETQLVFALLATTELLLSGVDAQAYTLQGLERSQRIQSEIANDSTELFEAIESYRGIHGDNPKEAYRLVGFGDFLRATVLEESPTRVSEAERAYARAFELSPDYPYAKEDLARVRGEIRPADGTGTVWVIGLTGRGPFLSEIVVDHPAESILLVLKQIWSYQERRVSFPFVTGIRVPELRFHLDNPAALRVDVAGRSGLTGTVTDIDKTAEIEFSAMRDTIVARAVFRRAVKLVLGELLKNQLQPRRSRRNSYGYGGYGIESLLIDISVAIWSSVERADLRSWSLLPARLQALRIELPAGEHTLEIRPTDATGQPVGPLEEIRVSVHQGRNTYVIGVAPTLNSPPTVLSSATHEPALVPSP